MTFFAVSDSHFIRVGFVALGALRDLAMDAVAGGTGKTRMLALVVPELSNLPGVAGETDVFAGK
jgi:hypothetical protein